MTASSRDARLARVGCVMAAGARAADPADVLGRETRDALGLHSGLSPAGVELALTEHLETSATNEELDALIKHAGVAPRCHVVLASNVCTAALRAMALAVATAPHVMVRPSRRDPVLAGILVRALSADPRFAGAGGRVEIVDAIRAEAGEELHAYGSDASLRAIGQATGSGVVLRGHGTGFGVAVVGAADHLPDAAGAVAGDVVPFDQCGCLSPRIVLVQGDASRALAFADALHRALGELSARVPRGGLDDDVRAAITAYTATLEAVGQVWSGSSHVIGLDPAPRALVLPPAARVVHVVPVHDASLLATQARFVTCIGANRSVVASSDDGLATAVSVLAPYARRVALGAMQRPPLDGPVDRRPTLDLR